MVVCQILEKSQSFTINIFDVEISKHLCDHLPDHVIIATHNQNPLGFLCILIGDHDGHSKVPLPPEANVSTPHTKEK